MIFSKQAIQMAMQKQLLVIDPFNEAQIEKGHINLHIGITTPLTVKPKDFVLATSLEKITFTKSICGFVEGRASLAKKGISVEQSSTFVEPGTDNHITLEIFNASDKEVTIEPSQQIAKLFITQVVDDI